MPRHSQQELPQQRVKAGQAQRKRVPRAAHAEWDPKLRGATDAPLTLLARSMEGRLPALVRIKYQRMLASPFGFFRGAVPVMAADLSRVPHTLLITQICGDAHVRNFGAYAALDGRTVFDINDFDESVRAPFEWDIKRMAASIIVAGRDAHSRDTVCEEAARSFLTGYRKRIHLFAKMPVLDVARHQIHGLQSDDAVEEAWQKARRSTPLQTLALLTEHIRGKKSGARKFRNQRPLLFRVHGREAEEVLTSLKKYRECLRPERRHFLDQYRAVDVGFKVVGTGSVGLRDYVVYLEGNSPADPLFIQIKEEPPSAYTAYLPAALQALVAPPLHQGQRVADAQRAMQLESDPFLGYTSISGRDYLVRQLNDHKGSINPADLKGDVLVEYAVVCGDLLARGHARSGDVCQLSGYLGNSARFDDALAKFALAYADQTERDWKELKKARK